VGSNAATVEAASMMIGAESRMGDIVYDLPQDARAFRERPDETLRRWALGVALRLAAQPHPNGPAASGLYGRASSHRRSPPARRP
jgi:hypothetical protein